ncbi:hypothetical protein [Bradyrhizobium barranii]
MTALASYSTGTVSVASGGTTVTGVGAIWSDANARPGDILQIGNFQSVITDKTDTTHLVIPPWGGGAQVGVAYKIWQVSPQRFAGAEAMATVNKLVAALDAREIPIVVGDDETEPDPSLGRREPDRNTADDRQSVGDDRRGLGFPRNLQGVQAARRL